jgi:transcriptional regulator with XRE-family HTH domain
MEDADERTVGHWIHSDDASGHLTLTQLRERMKLTRQEFGELCGISPRTIARWENNPARFDFNRVSDIAEATGAAMVCDNAMNWGWLSPGAVRVLEMYRKLSPWGQNIMSELMDRMRAKQPRQQIEAWFFAKTGTFPEWLPPSPKMQFRVIEGG